MSTVTHLFLTLQQTLTPSFTLLEYYTVIALEAIEIIESKYSDIPNDVKILLEAVKVMINQRSSLALEAHAAAQLAHEMECEANEGS